MGNDNILLTSGFVIPNNKWFTKLDIESQEDANLPQRLKDLITKGLLYSSSVANEAYLSYINKPDFDNYMVMVDIFTDIFKEYNYIKFCKDQTSNPYLSPLGFRMVLDTVSSSTCSPDFEVYSLVPNFISSGNSDEQKELAGREGRLNSAIDRNNIQSTSGYLAGLVMNRSVFSNIFKYMLTDFNRRGTHA